MNDSMDKKDPRIKIETFRDGMHEISIHSLDDPEVMKALLDAHEPQDLDTILDFLRRTLQEQLMADRFRKQP